MRNIRLYTIKEFQFFSVDTYKLLVSEMSTVNVTGSSLQQSTVYDQHCIFLEDVFSLFLV